MYQASWRLLIGLIFLYILINCLIGIASLKAQPLRPDSIYFNGHVLTVDNNFSVVTAFAVREDKFVAVGSDEEVKKLASSDTRQFDLEGQTVLPAFNDGHIHLLPVEPNFKALPLGQPKNMDDLLAAVSAAAQKIPEGQWLTFTANDWHPSALEEKRFPTRWELDKAAPDHPVYILRGGQTIIVNSLALKKAGITKDTQPPEGTGIIEKDQETGEPTGLLLSNARFLVRDVIPKQPLDRDATIAELVKQNELLNASGVTSVRDAGLTPDQIRVFQEARKRGALSLRVSMMYEPRSRQDPLDEVIQQMRKFGPVTGLGDEFLRLGGLKLHIDGAVESALLKEPYPNDPDYYGLINYPLEKFEVILEEASRLGWSVGVHTVGDKATEITLNAFEKVDEVYPIKEKRWALEHAMLGTEEEIEKIKKLGVVMSVQEWTFYQYSYPIAQSWGVERTKRLTPIKTWLENDLLVAGGTDHLPTPDLLNIQFLMIWSAITRRTQNVGVMGPDERISRQQAIWLHTHAPAYLTYEEDIKGTIETGKVADFIIISDDILSVSIEEVKDLRVLATFLGGERIFSAKDFEM